MRRPSKAKRQRLNDRLAELKADRALYRAARDKILNGDAFSYGTGQRTKTAYSMNLDQIEKKLKAIDDEIDEIESQLDGSGPRFVAGFVPCDW